jgi:hypothetical protein
MITQGLQELYSKANMLPRDVISTIDHRVILALSGSESEDQS